MICKDMGIATLQFSDPPRRDGAWSLKVAGTRCSQQRVEKGWVSEQSFVPGLCYFRHDSAAPQAGICCEAPIFVSSTCFKLEFLTVTAALTLVESWYIISLRHFFQHWVPLSNYIFHEKHLILLVWICHLRLSLHVLVVLRARKNRPAAFLPFAPSECYIVSHANDFSFLN